MLFFTFNFTLIQFILILDNFYYHYVVISKFPSPKKCNLDPCPPSSGLDNVTSCTLMSDFLPRFDCDPFHVAGFDVSLWLVLRLWHWGWVVSAVTGPRAALFAKGKAGNTQSSFRSIRFRSSAGTVYVPVQSLTREVQCLFAWAPLLPSCAFS